ncbi:MAG: type I restriction endonuclease subunit R [Cyanobacteria bacterium P01_H01_bin.121]
MATAVTEAITSLATAEQQFALQRIEAATFFPEWRENLPSLMTADRSALQDLRRRYLYQRSQGQLLEGVVTLLVASPLLMLAGFYDPPFQVRTEAAIRIQVADQREALQGRIDLLVLHDQVWVVVLESKQTMLSVWTALPQTLAYLMANGTQKLPRFAMLTNGDEIMFVKVQNCTPDEAIGSTAQSMTTEASQNNQPQPSYYDVSRIFALYTATQELEVVLQILRGIGAAFT